MTLQAAANSGPPTPTPENLPDLAVSAVLLGMYKEKAQNHENSINPLFENAERMDLVNIGWWGWEVRLCLS